MNHFLDYARTEHGLHTRRLIGFGESRYQTALRASINPTVIEERPMNVAQLDVFSRLMMDRIIFLGVAVDDYVANVIQAQLLFLASVDSERPITLYINSPGGSVSAGLGIYDTMQHVSCPVHTMCTSTAASMAAVLLCAGEAGHRSMLRHARVMIHQPSGGVQGKVSDMETSYRLVLQLQEELYAVMAKHSGQSVEQIRKDADRDHWMRAPEAKAYGFVDEIIGEKEGEAKGS